MSEKNKHRFVLACIALTTIPYLFFVNYPQWGTEKSDLGSIALYVSAVFGYIGLSFLVWELILGTRAISGLYFNDLSSKLKLHAKIGKYGTLFALLHPLFILLAFGENVMYLISPNISQEYEKHVTLGRLAFFTLLIVWLTSAIVRGKISYRPWKYIHYLSYPLIVATLLHIPDVGSSFHGRFIQFYWYSTLIIVGICFVLRLRHLFGYGKVIFVVEKYKKLTDNVVVLQLKATQKNITIKTGQYVYLQLHLYGEEHPFTVLDYNSTNGTITIAFKIFGKFTEKLSNVAVNSQIYIDGPYGVFTQEIEVSNEPSIFIAGGIGVTPFIKHALDNPRNRLFYANQTRKGAVFIDLLRAHLKNNFVELYSRESSTQQKDYIEHGRLNIEILKKYINKPEKFRYYICGPDGLIHSAKNNLLQLGVSEENIQAEEFSF